jgi:AcrR family transcriptional regulator
MRQLAKALGVTPMAIYYYFGNKDELMERISDAVLAQVPKPAPSGVHWREELRAYALHGFRLLSEYPGLSGQIIKRPPGKQSGELAAYGISILVAAGFDCVPSALAITTFHAYMFGMFGLQAQLELRADENTRRPGWDSPYLDTLNVPQLVEFGIGALLTGLESTLSIRREQEPPARKRRAPGAARGAAEASRRSSRKVGS